MLPSLLNSVPRCHKIMAVNTATELLTVYVCHVITGVSRSGRSVYSAVRQTFSPLHRQSVNQHGFTPRNGCESCHSVSDSLSLYVCHVINITGVSRSVYNAVRQTFSPLRRQSANKHGSILRSSNSKKKYFSRNKPTMETLETFAHPLRFKANLCLCLAFHLSQFHHFFRLWCNKEVHTLHFQLKVAWTL